MSYALIIDCAPLEWKIKILKLVKNLNGDGRRRDIKEKCQENESNSIKLDLVWYKTELMGLDKYPNI